MTQSDLIVNLFYIDIRLTKTGSEIVLSDQRQTPLDRKYFPSVCEDMDSVYLLSNPAEFRFRSVLSVLYIDRKNLS